MPRPNLFLVSLLKDLPYLFISCFSSIFSFHTAHGPYVSPIPLNDIPCWMCFCPVLIFGKIQTFLLYLLAKTYTTSLGWKISYMKTYQNPMTHAHLGSVSHHILHIPKALWVNFCHSTTCFGRVVICLPTCTAAISCRL